ncbi:MAG TPA: SGNH/GDSL hydrolase family protein [Burkholderiaceae bacterium]|nr:SGNH/GDSL hydrolase family protein [Burkholderiaceae bacterium]
MASRRHWHLATLAAAAAFLVAGCGGGSGITGAEDAPVAKRVVIFGDSLSDLGAYTPATSLAGNGTAPFFGGKFTTNTHSGYTAASNTSTANTWGEWIAARLGVSITPHEVGFGPQSVKCPAAATIGPNSCTGYAQGGSRVTDPRGIGNPNGTGLVGANPAPMTRPVVTQISDHLARFTGFDSGDIVFVWAGNNDAFVQLTAAGQGLPPATAIANMQTAATELANLVKTQILAKGATRVAVLTLPDASNTPGFSGLPAANKALLTQLSAEFNTRLVSDLAGTAARIIDARALSAATYSGAAALGLNATVTACDPAKISAVTGGRVTDGSSLFCNATAGAAFNGVRTGVTATSHLFADSVHPTTRGHQIFADQVFPLLKTFGWIPNNL